MIYEEKKYQKKIDIEIWWIFSLVNVSMFYNIKINVIFKHFEVIYQRNKIFLINVICQKINSFFYRPT